MKDRDWASLGDYRPVGGSNTNGFTCEPATVRVTGVSSGTAPGGGQIFLSPGDTTPVANNAALNGVCNLSVYNSFIPSQYRANGLIRVVNDFSEKLSLSASLLYNRNQTHADSGPGQLNNATVFGTGAGAAGQQNPFFTAPAGAAAATTEIINWLALRDDENYGYTESQQDVIYANVVLDYKINDNWSMTFADSIGWNRSSLDGFKQFCGACATLALNGTTQSGGSTTASSVPGQNVVVLQLPLTTGNALDVWTAGSANRTNPLVMDALYTSNSQNNNYNTFNQSRLVLQGALFDMPAGPLKIAVGGEFMWQEQQQKLSGGNNTGPTTTGSGYRVFNYDRDIGSGKSDLDLARDVFDFDVVGHGFEVQPGPDRHAIDDDIDRRRRPEDIDHPEMRRRRRKIIDAVDLAAREEQRQREKNDEGLEEFGHRAVPGGQPRIMPRRVGANIRGRPAHHAGWAILRTGIPA